MCLAASLSSVSATLGQPTGVTASATTQRVENNRFSKKKDLHLVSRLGEGKSVQKRKCHLGWVTPESLRYSS